MNRNRCKWFLIAMAQLDFTVSQNLLMEPLFFNSVDNLHYVFELFTVCMTYKLICSENN